jgi:ribosome-binding factor A
VAGEIRHHLADALSRGDLPAVRHPKGSGFLTFNLPITITDIELSPDMRHATVMFTPLGGTQKEQALQFLKLQRGYLRKILASKLQLRHVPDLHFRLDDSIDQADYMLKKIADVISNDEKLAANGELSTAEDMRDE